MANFKPLLSGWLDAGLSLLYPEVCQLCQNARAGPGTWYICAKCLSEVEYLQPPWCERCGLPFHGAITESFECGNCQNLKLHFARARSAVQAKGPVLEAIHGYKYRREMWFEGFLVDLLLTRAVPELVTSGGWDCLVPVPLHHVKQRERQFNQAERLAAPLARALGLPVRTDLVARVQPTSTQTRLSREDRQRNVRQAFSLRRGMSPAGLKVIVIDDVFTTGATTNACARVLAEGGAGEVCVWTVARGT